MNSFFSRLALAAGISFVFPVGLARAAAPSGRFVASNGVVRDSKTGLDWQQATPAATYTYAGALTYCAGLAGAAWRLPAIKELQSLVDDRAATAPTIDTIAFPSTISDPAYWSSTPYRGGVSTEASAWAVEFNYGDSWVLPQTSMNHVRCVR